MKDVATSPSGKAGVCKTPIAGSNPAVASSLYRPAGRTSKPAVHFFLPLLFTCTFVYNNDQEMILVGFAMEGAK